MKFVMDISVHRGLLAYPQERGHDVTAVGIHSPGNLPDPQILEAAYQERRILITADRDFGELVFYPRRAHMGVLLLRLRDSDINLIKQRVDVALRQRDGIDDFLVVTLRT
jgi:predicted nuclease of predicted toxin-antitoxin system